MPLGFRVAKKLQHGENAGWVLVQLRVGAAGHHLAGAREHLRGVDSDERRGEHAHGSQHAEASTHIRRDIQRWNSLGLRNGSQRALQRIGDEDDVVLRKQSCLFQPLAHYEILSHRLGGSAGLRRHDEQRALELDDAIEQSGDCGRIEVVEDMESRAHVALRDVQQIPLRFAQRRAQRDRAER